jgi:phospholipase/carboxylesterase
MTLPCIEMQTGPAPAASIIVLHGLGADGGDFVPVCEELDLAAAGDVRFVLPHAPQRPVTVNGGYVMRAWYDVFGFGGGHAEDEAGLRDSQRQIEALIQRERERGIAAGRIVLMGFSQGSAMALLTGLRHAEALAGIVALSGYLPLAAKTAAEQHAANAATRIFMAHGRGDDVVALGRGTASRDALLALGHDVEWHEYEIAHSVCMDEIADIQRWLLRVLD